MFGTCAVAYAVIPALFTERTGGWEIVFAGLCCLIGLTAGFFIQTAGRKIDRPGSPRASIVAMVLAGTGMVLAAWAAATGDIALGLISAGVLGCGYGMTLISGLLETQRIAGPPTSPV